MKKNCLKLCSVVLICVLLLNVLCSVNPVFAEEDKAFKCADTSGDGFINAEDALNVLKCAAKLKDGFSGEIELPWIIGDVTGDGTINAEDALDILKYSAKLISVFDISFLNAEFSVDDLSALVLENIENEVSLGQYKGIEVEIEKLVVTEEDIMAEIETILETAGGEELTDEVVAELFGEDGFTTVEDLKEFVRMYLEEALVVLQEAYEQQMVYEKIIADSTIHAYNDPALDVNKMCEETIAASKELAEYSEMSYAEYVSTIMNMTVEEFESEIRRGYQSYVDLVLVCRAIAKAENIVVSQEEFEAAYEEQLVDYEIWGYESVDEYAKAIYEELLYIKVQDMIMENSVVNYK